MEKSVKNVFIVVIMIVASIVAGLTLGTGIKNMNGGEPSIIITLNK